MGQMMDDYYDDGDYDDDEYDDEYVAPKPAAKPKPVKPQTPKPHTPKTKTPQNSASKTSSSKSYTAQNSTSSTKSTSSQLSNLTIDPTKIPKVELKDVLSLHKSEVHKPVLNLVIIGHVDAGKSTLTGHLLLKKGLVSDQEIHRNKKDAELVNKKSFEFAFIMDDDEQEREHGVTINVTRKTFNTEKYICALADAPGHRDFVPNMIGGAANADAAILVVDARKGEFESGFSESGQTREHALIVKSLGVGQLIVAVNKMDATGWSKDRFEEIQNILGNFLSKNVGFSKKCVTFIPVSGLSGENLTTRYNDKSKSLLEAIDSLTIPKRATDKPCRVSISDVSNVQETKINCLAKVEAGTVQTGQIFHLQPSSLTDDFLVQVCGVYRDDDEEYENEIIQEKENESFYGIAGETVGLDLKPIGLKFEQVYGSGMWLAEHKKPMKTGVKFRATILILGGDAQTYDNVAVPPITKGFNVTLHIGTTEVTGKISKIISLIDKKTGNSLPGRVRCLLKGNAATVVIRTDRPITADFENNLATRFTIRIQGITIGSGAFKSVVYE